MIKELDYSNSIENICALIDYILELKGEKEQIELLEIEELSVAESNIISEILINIDEVVFDLINNLLKAKEILKYTDDCDFETIQEDYKLIMNFGTKGYYKLLKKYGLDKENFEKITIK